MAVTWGRAHQDLTEIEAVGIDEIQWQHGHRYLTLVYQIDPGHTRLLWVSQARRVKTLLRFIRRFGRERTQALRFLCSDMWQPYLKVVAKKAGLFLDQWRTRAMRSRIDPTKEVARSFRAHRALLLNWCTTRGKISAGAVEGLNNKAKLSAKRAYGCRTCRCLEIALYHTLGHLPEPEAVHRFC